MKFEAVVVGAGPNGLAAAIEIARAGHSVLVVEANATIGGGARTEELTLPGFRHDACSAIHPLGVLSPFFATVPFEERGVEWIDPPLALAHPFDDGTAATLERGLEKTAKQLGADADAWRALFDPFDEDVSALFDELLRPVRIPRRPFLMARFGLAALQSAERLVARFRTEHARALFAGCAAHSFEPLESAGTASFGLVLAICAHAMGWPFPRGGASAITDALAAELRPLGGKIRTDERVTSLSSLREAEKAKAILFDVMPTALADIAGDALPASYAAALRRYRRAPGVFKIDWALSAPIPWRARECASAGTIHLGGSFDELAASERAPHEHRHSPAPFVLVAQHSLFDPTRAPPDQHTAWAYCHVPNGSRHDMTHAIEAQLERFAPGFRDCVLARHVFTCADLEAHDANLLGGDVVGGRNDLAQVLARPLARWDPYATPNPRLFLASSATPPGGGVHGMCGYWAARSALAKAFR